MTARSVTVSRALVASSKTSTAGSVVEGAGYPDALPLPAGQTHSAFSHKGIVPAGKLLHDELMHLRHLNGTTGATQVLPFLLLQLQFTRPRGCPGPTFPTLCPLRQVSFSVGSATPTNVSCAHFESSSDRSCAPAFPATVRRRGDVPPNPNRVGPRSRSAQRPRPRNPPPRTMRRMTRSTIAPTTATPKLGQFHPVTPDCPN